MTLIIGPGSIKSLFCSLLLLSMAGLLMNCSGGEVTDEPLADRLHRESLVWDAHSDIVQSILLQDYVFSERNTIAFQDIPRMEEGGLDVQILACLPDWIYSPRKSARRTLQLLDAMLEAMDRNSGKIGLARTASDVERIVGEGRIAGILAIEGGHAIEDDLGLLRTYNRLGVTLMTLTHGNTNNWADSSTDKARHGGLTDFGREVVIEMNRLNMVIDVSHMSDEAFSQVLEISADPVIASHSNCHALCNHPRNLSDDMIRALSDKGGVICVTTVPGYTTQAFKDARDAAVKAARADQPPIIPEPEDLDERAKLKRLSPAIMPDMPFPNLGDVLEHVDHLMELVGPDHIGIGHDFSVLYPGPAGLEDVSKYPNLTRRLLEKGYPAEDIQKILGGNLLRVWREVTKKEIVGQNPNR